MSLCHVLRKVLYLAGLEMLHRALTLCVLVAGLWLPSSASARSGRDANWDAVAQGRTAASPVLAVVALKEQRVTIYDADGPMLRAPISTGQTGLETPVGVFSILQKEAEHYSNRYDDAAMPFMERITWSGIALHAGALPGYPASHGCIRLPYGFAEKLFRLTKLGMRVVVARDDVAPIPISHPALLRPKLDVSEVHYLIPTADQPPQSAPKAADQARVPDAVKAELSRLQSIAQAKKAEADAAAQKADKAKQAAQPAIAAKKQALNELGAAERVKSKAEEEVSEAEQMLQKAKSLDAIGRAEEKKARAAAKLDQAAVQLEATRNKLQPSIDTANPAIEAAQAADAERAAAVEAAREAKLKLSPVSIFISLKTQRLYVRQGTEPVLEMPVTIRDPDRPIGTHIFTAVDYADGGGDVRWSVVSLGGRQQSDEGRSGHRHRNREQDSSSAAAATVASAAAAALDRVTIPQEVIDRFSQSVWVGSSLIISDEDLNKETGPATDFIVVSSTDPQGGLMMRKPEFPRIERAARYAERGETGPIGRIALHLGRASLDTHSAASSATGDRYPSGRGRDTSTSRLTAQCAPRKRVLCHVQFFETLCNENAPASAQSLRRTAVARLLAQPQGRLQHAGRRASACATTHMSSMQQARSRSPTRVRSRCARAPRPCCTSSTV